MNPLDIAAKTMPRITAPQVLLLVALTLVIACFVSYQAGGYIARADALATEKARTQIAVDKLKQENEGVLNLERATRVADKTRFDQFMKKADDEKVKSDKLIADLRTRAVRLYAPVRAYCPAAQVPGGAIAEGAGQEGRAELTPDAGEFLVRLLDRGDSAIRKHIEVVDRYDRLAAACSGATIPPTETEISP
jgi:hypothetical protein